jgi:ABC-2 type transport system ATP-binding protein
MSVRLRDTTDLAQPSPPTAASEHAVCVRELTHRYGDFTAVERLDLTVARGERYALLGSNGAGKTTTLEIIQGHRQPTEGDVTVLGHPTGRAPALRSRVGIMLQESGFAGDLNVRETVALFGRLSGRPDDVDRVLGLVDLAGKATTRVEQLSGGERRRLDFATAIWGAPELVFLDEPTTGMDPAARERLWQVVERLGASGSTILLTTHYLEEASRFADRIGILHHGRLVAEGTLTELVALRPARITVALRDGGAQLPLPHTRKGTTCVIETRDLQRDLHLVMTWAHERGVVFDDINVRSSSLEELFLDLTRDNAGALP